MRVVPLLVFTLLFAGCSAPEGTQTRAEENLEVSLNAIDGPYAVGLPLWVSEETTAAVWLAKFQELEWPAELSLRETAYGTALWVEADVSIQVSAHQLRTVYDEARLEPHFADGRYSLTDGDGRPGFIVEHGLAEVTAWIYDGVSEDCGLAHVHSRTDPALRWNPFAGVAGSLDCV